MEEGAALFVDVQSWGSTGTWIDRDNVQSAVAHKTKVGGRCKSKTSCVKWRPGYRIMRKSRCLKTSLNYHMRVWVPGIPQAILNAKPSLSVQSLAAATETLADFIKSGNIAVLTGAGVSVDSGIRAYRGEDGRYMNPDYKPIFYHELIGPTEKNRVFRQRYWLRSYLGYPAIRDALPNTTHFALATLQHTSYISSIITQNVDGLHQKSLRSAAPSHWSDKRIQQNILELHGTLHQVHCNRGHRVDRDSFQAWLSAANPKWFQYAQDLERTGARPRTNPDGDVAVEHLGTAYNDFVVPECPSCMIENHRNSVHKPEVVFFGESIPESTKARSYQEIDKCDKLLLIGTTLATYSAFRLLKHAIELKKPALLLNVGPTRADGLPGLVKLDVRSGAILRDATRVVIGARAQEDPLVAKMLRSGVKNPPACDDDDRAAG